jgi:hypothetical protein
VIEWKHGYTAQRSWWFISSSVSYRVDTEIPEENSEGDLKEFVAERMHFIEEYHPDVERERFSIQMD